uniref:Uncharacterized protein n=1 Tax=Sphaerodactylus townsendi TaxID=933632 RepID=A0ACB8EV03_9SAUR
MALLPTVLKEIKAQEEIGDQLAHLAEMVFPDNLDFLDSQAHLDPQALAETSLLSCPMAMTRNLVVVWQFQDQWVHQVPVVFLVLLAALAHKVSSVPLVNPESPELLVQWVPVVQPALLARTEMMVNLENLAVLVSVVLLAHREPVVFPELLVFQA